VIELASNVEVQYNTITDCVDGIVIANGSSNNSVRHNRIIRAGGGIPVPGRVGQGIQVLGNSSSNFIDANVIENTTQNHGIGIWYDGEQFNNMISSNTIAWDDTPSDPNRAAIWNGGNATKMWYNVVRNAPIGILHNGDHPGEIRENNIVTADEPIWNFGVTPASRTCNRVRGVLETSGCVIGCAGEGCSYIANSQSYSYFTDYQCAGSEYISTAAPYTWNGTGKRSNASKGAMTFPSRREPNGLCVHWCTNGDCPNGAFFVGNTYKGYR
jgi:parallel beta-helix repeat protein